MKSFTRYGLSIGAAALFAGCGALRQAQDDTQLPAGAPGVTPQSRAIAPARFIVHHMRAASPAYRVLYSFSGGSDGEDPSAALIDVNGTLYGTTAGGTSNIDGTVFSISTSGSENVLHVFDGYPSDGDQPEGNLIDVNGVLYDTTFFGGKYRKYPGQGTVFSISTTGTERVLHSFGKGSDGQIPEAGLLDMNGTLYGTTPSGGTIGDGTVFSISTSGKEHVLYSFSGGSDGGDPSGSLIEVNGTMYGTTYGGGAYGPGTVYTVSTTGVEHVLYEFWQWLRRSISAIGLDRRERYDVRYYYKGWNVRRWNGLQHQHQRERACAVQLHGRLRRRAPRCKPPRHEWHALRHDSGRRQPRPRYSVQHHYGRHGAGTAQLRQAFRWCSPRGELNRRERHPIRHHLRGRHSQVGNGLCIEAIAPDAPAQPHPAQDRPSTENRRLTGYEKRQVKKAPPPSWERTDLVVRTVFKIAEVVARRLVGSIPTRSRQIEVATLRRKGAGRALPKNFLPMMKKGTALLAGLVLLMLAPACSASYPHPARSEAPWSQTPRALSPQSIPAIIPSPSAVQCSSTVSLNFMALARQSTCMLPRRPES